MRRCKRIAIIGLSIRCAPGRVIMAIPAGNPIFYEAVAGAQAGICD